MSITQKKKIFNNIISEIFEIFYGKGNGDYFTVIKFTVFE